MGSSPVEGKGLRQDWAQGGLAQEEYVIVVNSSVEALAKRAKNCGLSVATLPAARGIRPSFLNEEMGATSVSTQSS